MTETSSRPKGPLAAPSFSEVRNYTRNIQQREALGGFIKAGWTPAELGEFARAAFLANGKTYPTAASYQYAMEKGVEHPFARETLASLRAPDFTMPPFNRPRPPKYEWDAPENPDHTPELKADIEVMACLWPKFTEDECMIAVLDAQSKSAFLEFLDRQLRASEHHYFEHGDAFSLGYLEAMQDMYSLWCDIAEKVRRTTLPVEDTFGSAIQ
jgi:hypothetical protein